MSPCRWMVAVSCALALSSWDLVSAQVAAEVEISSIAGGLTGPLADGDRFGCAVKSLGDLDGDGVDDLAVGAHLDDDGFVDAGAVWILFLHANGTVRSEQKISETQGGFGGLAAGDSFGRSLETVGDLDGDGVVDLVVGAHRDDDGLTNAGAVWVLFLKTDGTVKAAQKISDTAGNFLGQLDPEDRFGRSVVCLGDFDGDGTSDISVGANRDDDGVGSDLGALWLLFLQPDGTVKNHRKISATAGPFPGLLNDGDQFGTSQAYLGDLNGDQVPDLAVGANRDDDGGSNRGAVWIMFLTSRGLVQSAQKISNLDGGFGGTLDDDGRFGASLAWLVEPAVQGAGTLAVGANQNNDGGAARGQLWLLSVRQDGTVASERKISSTVGGLTGPLQDGDWFGRSVATLGDLDGNGVWDLVGGAALDDGNGTDRGALYLLGRSVDGALTGPWYGFTRWELLGADDSGWDLEHYSIDSGGEVLGGRLRDSELSRAAITGGLAQLNAAGDLDWSMTYQPGGTDTFDGLQLVDGADVIVGVATDSQQYRTLEVAVRGGGTFQTSDLQGDWFWFGHWDDVQSHGPSWVGGFLSVNATGLITTGFLIDDVGTVTNLTGLTVSLSRDGLLTDSLGLLSEPMKMNRSKDFLAGVSSDSPSDSLGLNVLVKGGGSFTTADLAGTWRTYRFRDHPAANAPAWVRGTIQVQASGAVTGGSVMDSDGGSASITGGSLSLDALGQMTGTIDFSPGGTETLTQYKMGPAKNLLAGVHTDSQGAVALELVVREPVWVDHGFGLQGTNGVPRLTGTGPLTPGSPLDLDLTGARGNSSSFWIVGFFPLYLPFQGGVLMPNLDFIFVFPIGPAGTLSFSATWPTGVPSDFPVYYQVWVADPAAVQKLSGSNALSGTTR